jgi:hypothetical protein
MRAMRLFIIMLLTLYCSESGFNGSAPQPVQAPTDPSQKSSGSGGKDPTDEDFNDTIKKNDTRSTDELDTNNNRPTPNNSSTTPSNGANGSDKPVGVVDGSEVYDRCETCERRGIELGRQQGFQTGKDKSINLGFYKIDPAKGLCDVHFMADLRIPIDDHSGKSTIGNRQIILYCPCNCDWKDIEELGFSNGPPPFGGGFGGGW